MGFWDVIGKYIADSWDMLIGRSGGPFALRFILQPTMATIFAIRAGLRDAKAGRPPYLWSVSKAEDKYDRRALMRDGWKDIGKVFTIAIILDVIYEIVEFKWVYPIQALIIACVLALIPYIVIRGLTMRIVSRMHKSEKR